MLFLRAFELNRVVEVKSQIFELLTEAKDENFFS